MWVESSRLMPHAMTEVEHLDLHVLCNNEGQASQPTHLWQRWRSGSMPYVMIEVGLLDLYAFGRAEGWVSRSPHLCWRRRLGVPTSMSQAKAGSHLDLHASCGDRGQDSQPPCLWRRWRSGILTFMPHVMKRLSFLTPTPLARMEAEVKRLELLASCGSRGRAPRPLHLRQGQRWRSRGSTSLPLIMVVGFSTYAPWAFLTCGFCCNEFLLT